MSPGVSAGSPSSIHKKESGQRDIFQSGTGATSIKLEHEAVILGLLVSIAQISPVLTLSDVSGAAKRVPRKETRADRAQGDKDGKLKQF